MFHKIISLLENYILPQILKKLFYLLIALLIFTGTWLLLKFLNISLIETLKLALSETIIGLLSLLTNHKITFNYADTTIILNETQTFYFSVNWLSIRYYLAILLLLFFLEERNKNFLWLSVSGIFLYFFISVFYVWAYIERHNFIIGNFSQIIQQTFTVVISIYLLYKNFYFFSKKNYSSFNEFFYKSTIPQWLFIFSLWWIVFIAYFENEEFKRLFYYYSAHFLNVASSFLLNLLGYDSYVIGRKIYGSNHWLFVGRPCVGIGVIHVFWAIMILLSGRFWFKLIYMIIGALLITFFNILRITFLFIYIEKHGGIYDGRFNMHDMYNAYVYSFIILLWILYLIIVNRKLILAKIKKQTKT